MKSEMNNQNIAESMERMIESMHANKHTTVIRSEFDKEFDDIKYDLLEFVYIASSLDEIFIENLLGDKSMQIVEMCKQEDEIRIYGLKLLGNLISHENNEYSTKAIDAGCMDILNTYIYDSDNIVLAEVFYSLCNLTHAYGFTTEHYKIFDRSIELLKITDSDLISVKNRILEFLKELFDKENLSVIEYFINNNIFEYLCKAIEDNITYSSVEYAIKCILHIFQSEKVDDLCEKHYLLKFTDINGFERVDKAMEFIQYQELNDYWSNICELFLSDDHNIQLYEDEENENS